MVNFPVMNVVTASNINGLTEFFNAFSSFLSGQGWTINRDLRDVDWVRYSGYVAGSGSTIDFSGTGYPNQTIHCRVERTTYYESASRWALYGGLGFGDPQVDINRQDPPVMYFYDPVDTNWHLSPFSLPGAYGAMKYFLSKETMARVWFFGWDTKYWCVVCQLDSNRFAMFHAGSIVLQDTSAEYGVFMGPYDIIQDWKTNILRCGVIPVSYYFPSFWDYDRNRLSTGASGHVLDCSTAESYRGRFVLNTFNRDNGILMARNDNSELRPIVAQCVFVRDSSDNSWFFGGHTPYGHTVRTGYGAPEEVRLGAEKYLVFPQFHRSTGSWGTSSIYGVAFRVE